MATSSIYKQVRLTKRSQSRRLVEALERAESTPCKKVTFRKQVREIKGADIRKAFGVIE